MFVPSEWRTSGDYQEFWRRLNLGQFDSGEYKRINKKGEEIWMQASYNPILDLNGKPYKVVKFATDITEQKIRSANYQGQIDAIGKSQAVIEFCLDGTILWANENFLNAMGYRLDEIKGQHHSMFVDATYKNSQEYKNFWQTLQKGEYISDEFKRFAKGGKEIWIQASYNPIFDPNGKPYKVVKYATDVTQQKLQFADYSGQIQAISLSQAVIEFNMDGTIRNANKAFLGATGYQLDEIKNKHHSMFVSPEYRNSSEYQDFWKTLQRGEYVEGEFQRFGKGGQEIWIQASYNPILDLNGQPFKVVKYATDITSRKIAVNAISESLIQLSEGDLNAQVTVDLEGEFAELKSAMNSTCSRLRNMVADIRESASTVGSAAREMQSGTEDLSQRN